MRIGVLALQGGFAPHLAALAAIGHEPFPVRAPNDLERAEGLVLPGGESTAQRRLIAAVGLEEPLRRAVRRGIPLLVTCAGLILAADRIRTGSTEHFGFGFLDVTVARNAWGRQVDSFEARDDRLELPLVFIRAPRIVDVGPRASVRATLDGEPVLIRQGNVVGATFHPELTSDARVLLATFGSPTEYREPCRGSEWL
jgi:5'-phosphate synthase pdxT subunit